MQNEKTVACFLKIADYSVPFNILIKGTLGYDTVECPPITKNTVEVGAKLSPDTVCTPFKIILGNFLEAMEKGANALVMPAFGCRLGFYDVLMRQILADEGHSADIINLFDYTANEKRLYDSLLNYNPGLSEEDFKRVLALVVRVVIDMDHFGEYIRKNAAFENEKGALEKNYKKYLAEVKNVTALEQAVSIGEKYRAAEAKIQISKPAKPIKIGIIGDLYSCMEPHGNCNLERWLIDNGVEIHRSVTLSYLATSLFDVNALIEKSGGYVNYSIGGNANNTVALAYEMAKGGIDGLIHVKAATCTPEITAMTVLQNIARDFSTPIIFFTFDTETGEAGVHTRLEAFLDMLNMKRARRKTS
jgi:predicted nucleotide-binding protein (sugar kinase/HSP70/actin superfamily)